MRADEEQIDQLKDAHQNVYLLLSYDQGYEDKIKIILILILKAGEESFSRDSFICV